MIQSEINIKSGASFKSIVREDCFDSVDDAYKAFAACAVFQAFKDYKNWLVARHFAIKDWKRIERNYRATSVMMHLCGSVDVYKHRRNRMERIAVVTKRIKRIAVGGGIVGNDEYLENVLKAIKRGDFKDIRSAVKTLRQSAIRDYHYTIDVIKGRTSNFENVEHFFESPEFALYSQGLDGEPIKQEAIRRANEKIRRKELGLPDDEEDDDEES